MKWLDNVISHASCQEIFGKTLRTPNWKEWGHRNVRRNSRLNESFGCFQSHLEGGALWFKCAPHLFVISRDGHVDANIFEFLQKIQVAFHKSRTSLDHKLRLMLYEFAENRSRQPELSLNRLVWVGDATHVDR
jgi:hypothetical protein